MALAQWTQELETGVAKVDEQHKELIRMVNSLHDALSQGKAKEHIEEAFDFMAHYVVEHFQMEERMMTEHNYVGFPAHKHAHNYFIHDFSALTSKYHENPNSSFMAIQLQKAILEWLLNHIMKVDKEMAKAINAKSHGSAA